MKVRILLEILPFLKNLPGIKEMVTAENGRKVLDEVPSIDYSVIQKISNFGLTHIKHFVTYEF